MPTYHDAVKKILEHNLVAEGEKVVASLEGTEYQAKWTEIIDLMCREVKLAKEVQDLSEASAAKRTLFWQEVAKASERAESADERGMVLGVRYDENDRMVLVEFSPKEDESSKLPPQLRAFMSLLKKMRGETDES